MKIQITINIDIEESGYNNEDELKDNLINFTRDLLINGAENEEVEFTLTEVNYL